MRLGRNDSPAGDGASLYRVAKMMIFSERAFYFDSLTVYKRTERNAEPRFNPTASFYS